MNFDLIYGLPYQTPASFERTLDHVVGLRPTASRSTPTPTCPGSPSTERLRAHGPARAGASSRCLPALARLRRRRLRVHRPRPLRAADDELGRALERARCTATSWATPRRRRATWSRSASRASATSRGCSCRTPRSRPRYYEALDAGRFPTERGYVLDEDDALRRHVITELMCNGHLDVREVERRFGVTFAEYFAPELADLAAPGSPQADGLVRVDADALDVTPVGGCSCATSAWCSTATCAPAPRRHAGLQPHGMSAPRVVVVGAGAPASPPRSRWPTTPPGPGSPSSSASSRRHRGSAATSSRRVWTAS